MLTATQVALLWISAISSTIAALTGSFLTYNFVQKNFEAAKRQKAKIEKELGDAMRKTVHQVGKVYRDLFGHYGYNTDYSAMFSKSEFVGQNGTRTVIRKMSDQIAIEVGNVRGGISRCYTADTLENACVEIRRVSENLRQADARSR